MGWRRAASVFLSIVISTGCTDVDLSRMRRVHAKPMGECSSSGPARIPPTARRYGIDVDLDGDGRRDRFTVWIKRSSGVPGESHMRVRTATGAVIDRETFTYAHEPVVIGATDVNDDGTPEVWVGAKRWEAVWAAMLIDCELHTLDATERELTPKEIEQRGGGNGGWRPEWFTVRFPASDGVFGTECVDIDGDGTREIVEYERSKARPASFTYLVRHIEGTRAVVVDRKHPLDHERPRAVSWESGFRCDGLSYPSAAPS
jgi:hypothetical protein